MGGEPFLVPAEQLRDFVQILLERTGFTPNAAACTAESLVWSDLHGQAGHGVARLPLYRDWVRKGSLDPLASPEVKEMRRAILLVEAHRCAGALAIDVALAAAVARAKDCGLCFALVRETSHTGAIGQYAQKAAEQGLATIMGVSGPAIMAFHGAAVPGVSTSPLAMAAPRGSGRPVVLDMSSSVVAFGRIIQARKAGETIPLGWALDSSGRPTTDAKEAVVPLPLGGPKGSGLALMFEIFAGLLSGNPLLASTVGSEEGRQAAMNGLQNVFLLLVEVEVFRSLEDFCTDVEELAAAMQALPKAAGIDTILLPGERGAATERQRRLTGLPVARPVAKELEQIARELGVPVPPTLLA